MSTPVVHALAPAPAGGLETVVASLATAQVRAGRPVEVLAWLDPGEVLNPPLDRLGEDGVRVVEIRSGRRYWKDIVAARDLLADRPNTVVHTHGYRADVLAGLASRLARRPRVATVHGRTGGGWKNRFYERLQLLSYRFADVVVGVSRRLCADLVDEGVDPSRVVAIPNAWELPAPPLGREEARRELGLSVEGPAVGWVGRVSREKGPDLMVDVVEALDRDDVLFAVIGEGPLRASLERRTRAAGLEDRVRWCGLVPEAYRVLRAFDALLLTSRTEGMPMVVLEAMAAGVPVVAPEVGGIPEMVGEPEAFLVSSSEPEGLARAVRRLLGDPGEARRRAARARARREREFGVETWAQRYAEVYEELVDGGSTSGDA